MPSCGAGWFEDEPVFTAGNEGGALLDIRFEHSEQLWPWSGFLALYVRVRDTGVTFSGQARPSPQHRCAGEMVRAHHRCSTNWPACHFRSFALLNARLRVNPFACNGQAPRLCLPPLAHWEMVDTV